MDVPGSSMEPMEQVNNNIRLASSLSYTLLSEGSEPNSKNNVPPGGRSPGSSVV